MGPLNPQALNPRSQYPKPQEPLEFAPAQLLPSARSVRGLRPELFFLVSVGGGGGRI